MLHKNHVRMPFEIGTTLANAVKSEVIALIRYDSHFAALPLFMRMGVPEAVQVSLCIHTTRQEIDALLDGFCAARRNA